MAMTSGSIFIGIGGHIVAINTGTGEEIWRSQLKRSADHATVWFDGTHLYGAASGELFGLNPATGDILWRNKLKGLGTGIIAFPAANDAVVAGVNAAHAAAAAGAIAATS
jgi:outer membrane protein assembly factor BamB